jgi:hypothetical protein
MEELTEKGKFFHIYEKFERDWSSYLQMGFFLISEDI